MKQYDRNKILNTFPMLNGFNKSNGLAWRIIEHKGFKVSFLYRTVYFPEYFA